MELLEGVSIQVLRLEPGDHIVVQTHRRLSLDEAFALRARVEEHFPGFPVAVMHRCSLSVLRGAEAEAS